MNEKLSLALEDIGLEKANPLQKAIFGTIKSGADCVVIAPKKSGKTTAIVLSVIQQLGEAFEESPRALIIVQDKVKMLEMKELFDRLGGYTDLRVYGVHDQGNTDYDKNHISVGIDVLIGTPNKLSEMFSTAGYNVNKLKMFILEDVDTLLKSRFETKIARISESMNKTQRLFFGEQTSERVEILADRILIEPNWFEMEIDEEEDDEEQEA